MTAAPQFHPYADRDALAIGLASGVAAVLAGAIATRGQASLVVSGGSTPKRLFSHLASTAIDWASVTVVLVDERWVPETHERSNAAMVRDHLLTDRAAAAHFVSLYEEADTPEAVLDVIEARVRPLGGPIDAVILGMGEDGHTASFFPQTDDLAAALAPVGDAPVAVVRAPGAGEPRVTLTLPHIVDARFLAIHIEGDAKRDVFETACRPGPVEAMPVRAVLNAERPEPVAVFWAP